MREFLGVGWVEVAFFYDSADDDALLAHVLINTPINWKLVNNLFKVAAL